jgi:O-6-methylguanine DNA methyltransferase
MEHVNERDGRDEALAHGRVMTWAGTTRVTASAVGVRSVWLPSWRNGARHEDDGRMPAGAVASVIEGGDDPAALAHLRQALDELGEFFTGRRRDFTVALDPRGPDFYAAIWAQVASVPYGETHSYGEIARAVGQPDAARAVGAANGANPVAPFVPCHRIVGSDGRLTGYGPGLPLKQLLLEMEGALPSGADEESYTAWVARLRERYGQGLLLGVRATRAACQPECAVARRHAALPARFFRDADEAAAAGFTACKSCGSRTSIVSIGLPGFADVM